MTTYAKLDIDGQRAFAKRLVQRRELFVKIAYKSEYSNGLGRVLLVGDRPGPSAPKDDGYHHTPFYSTKYCSGWLNALLVTEGIPEDKLAWVNSADQNGIPTSTDLIDGLEPAAIVCLGGNAEKWVKKAGHSYLKVDHPQYHKRFKNKERYPLIDLLKELTSA